MGLMQAMDKLHKENQQKTLLNEIPKLFPGNAYVIICLPTSYKANDTLCDQPSLASTPAGSM